MKCILCGTVENVESYEGKNGFGATITLSSVDNKKRTFLKFNTKVKSISNMFEDKLQEEVEVTISLDQNNFGLRLGEVVSVDGEDIPRKKWY